ncbi:MAG: hypothetical protein ABID38_05020 [Candidatus Diapherotrites archaeon]
MRPKGRRFGNIRQIKKDRSGGTGRPHGLSKHLKERDEKISKIREKFSEWEKILPELNEVRYIERIADKKRANEFTAKEKKDSQIWVKRIVTEDILMKELKGSLKHLLDNSNRFELTGEKYVAIQEMIKMLNNPERANTQEILRKIDSLAN